MFCIFDVGFLGCKAVWDCLFSDSNDDDVVVVMQLFLIKVLNKCKNVNHIQAPDRTRDFKKIQIHKTYRNYKQHENNE